MQIPQNIIQPWKREFCNYATTWMRLEDINVSEMNQSQKDKDFMIELLQGN